MRNSADPDTPPLIFTAAEWAAFTAEVKDGRVRFHQRRRRMILNGCAARFPWPGLPKFGVVTPRRDLVMPSASSRASCQG